MNMIRVVAMILGVALTVTGAYLQGKYTNRWGAQVDFESLATVLQEFPKQLGDWELVSEGEELSAGVIEELGVKGAVSRSYRRVDGQAVTMLLMLGETGPLIRHPPEICYSNSGKRVEERSKTVKMEGQGELRMLFMVPNNLSTAPFTVSYGFYNSKSWSCPQVPRLTLGAEPYLYKLQILTAVPSEDEKDPVMGAVQDFASQLTTWLQSQQKKST